MRIEAQVDEGHDYKARREEAGKLIERKWLCYRLQLHNKHRATVCLVAH